ncbi:MAG: acetyl-CoA carboxylase biotin carboxyl carrier protein subunit [Anaerolineales bacterium]
MKNSFSYNSEAFFVDLTSTGKSHHVAIDDKAAEVEILHAENGKLSLLIDGERVIAYVSSDGAKRWVTINGQTFALTRQSRTRKSGSGGQRATGELTAPMPGLVRSVNVAEGESVAKGQTLLVLEAMKMEIRIHAPVDGMVKKLLVKQGQTVEREQVLITVE